MRLFAISLIAVLISFGGPAMAADEIAHRVISEDGDIQIRDYEETVVAEVTVKGTRREAPGIAFRTLFNFIQGANTAAREIPMTTPVSQQENQNNQWTIAFYMPNDMSYEDTPKPKDERITIRRVPAQRMIAIQFSGRATDGNIAEHETELRAYMAQNDIGFDDKPIYAFYNSPWTPWFLRRNEVLFTLQTEAQ